LGTGVSVSLILIRPAQPELEHSDCNIIKAVQYYRREKEALAAREKIGLTLYGCQQFLINAQSENKTADSMNADAGRFR